MPPPFSIIETSLVSPGPGSPSVPSANFLLRPQSSRNGFHGVVTWVLETKKVAWCQIRWIRWLIDGMKEFLVKKFTTTGRCGLFAKNSALLEGAEHWHVSRFFSLRTISLTLAWRFSSTISFTSLMLSSVVDDKGRPEQGMSSTVFRPSLKTLY